MAKKKSGSIAVPFLATIFIGLLILGGAAFFIYNKYLKKDDSLSFPKGREVKIVSYDDSHTVLLILDEPERDECKQTFVLMRSVPKDKRILFLGLPTTTIALVDGKQQSLIGAYERGGGASAAEFVSSFMGQKVEKYMKFDSETFRSTCDKLGCVTYPIDVDIPGTKNDGTFQGLTSEQMDTFVTYTQFKGGETERAFRAASITSYMINGSDGNYIADNLDSMFNSTVNSTETNITSVDFKDYKEAITDMFSKKKMNGEDLAVAIQFEGSDADGEFIPGENFIKQIGDQYFKEEE